MRVKNMKDHKIWIDEDGIIRCVFSDVYMNEDVEDMIEGIVQISKKGEQAMVIIDLKKTKTSTSSARRIIVESIKADPEIYHKLALLGSSAKNKVLANFIIRASGRGDKVRYFESEEEALRWLGE
jgi:hypothetical protein